MIDEWAAALEATKTAAALRNSVWIYPLVNAGHILGVALLVGSIVPLDLRSLGFWRSVPLGPLSKVLTRTAAAGLVLAMAFGALLFIARATEYITSNFFLAKMAVVVLGITNAVFLRGVYARASRRLPPSAKNPARLRTAAAISLTAWLAALMLGRLIGYF